MNMIEAEWLESSEPHRLLHFIQSTGASERKIRRFNAAICRRFWNYLPQTSRDILTESELLADGLSLPNRDHELCSRANTVVGSIDRQYPDKKFPTLEIRIQRDAAAAVCYAVLPNELFGAYSYFEEIDPQEKGPQSTIIRDIFGNPFRPVSADSTWLAWNDGTIPKLAQSIHDERAFDRMPILADALEEAGCTDADILNHCRQPGEHVRGCWVVDLILGKM